MGSGLNLTPHPNGGADRQQPYRKGHRQPQELQLVDLGIADQMAMGIAAESVIKNPLPEGDECIPIHDPVTLV